MLYYVKETNDVFNLILRLLQVPNHVNFRSDFKKNHDKYENNSLNSDLLFFFFKFGNKSSLQENISLIRVE
jgi:hypothetical protein